MICTFISHAPQPHDLIGAKLMNYFMVSFIATFEELELTGA